MSEQIDKVRCGAYIVYKAAGVPEDQWAGRFELALLKSAGFTDMMQRAKQIFMPSTNTFAKETAVQSTPHMRKWLAEQAAKTNKPPARGPAPASTNSVIKAK